MFYSPFLNVRWVSLAPERSVLKGLQGKKKKLAMKCKIWQRGIQGQLNAYK